MEKKERNIKNNEFFLLVFEKIARKENKSVSALSQSLYNNKNFFSFLKAGKQSYTLEKLDKLCAVFPYVNRNYILTGEGEAFYDETNSSEINSIISEDKYLFSEKKFREDALPLIPVAAIGGNLLDNNFPVRLEDCDWFVIPQFKGLGAKYLIRVSGNSMSPLYPDGTLLAIKDLISPETIHWGEAYVLNTIDGSVVKRLKPYEEDADNYFLCVSENEEKYPSFKIHKSEVISIFQVVGAITIKF